MFGPEITWNMRFMMLLIALWINWEFVTFTLAHFIDEDAKIDANRAHESLKAQQSPADLERLYLRAHDAHDDVCKAYLNTTSSSSDPAEDSMIENPFKCLACVDHGLNDKWRNAGRNRPNPTQNDEFEDFPREPVTWRYLRHQQNLDGVVVSDVYQPLFHCENDVLWMKFAITRHSNPRLIIKTNWTDSLSQKQCQCIKRNNGPSMLLRTYFKDCYALKWTGGRRMYYSVRVLYFDRLLMRNLSGTATCHAAFLPHDVPSTRESPEVICGKPYVIIKLPAKKIINVTVLDMSMQLPRPVLWKSHHTVFVKLKHSAIKDGMLQVDYLDVIGKTRTITGSCVQQTFKNAIRKRRQDPFDFIWEYDPMPTVPFEPEWATITAPLHTIIRTGISPPSESGVPSIVTNGPFDIPPDATVDDGLEMSPSTDRQPIRITKTATNTVDVNVELGMDFGLSDFDVKPTVPCGEFEETPKMTQRILLSSTPKYPDPTTWTNMQPFRPAEMTLDRTQKVETSSAATQPSRITKTAPAGVHGDGEFWVDFGLSDFDVIPTVPCGEFEENPKTTQRMLPSSTPTHPGPTTWANTVTFRPPDITLDTNQTAEYSTAATQPGRITKTATPTVQADVEFGTDFGLLYFDVTPTVPCGEFEETPKKTTRILTSSTPLYPDPTTRRNTTPFRPPDITLGTTEKSEASIVSTQPGIITKTTSPAAADIEFGTGFDLSEFNVIPTLPRGEFEETPKTTPRILPSSTPLYPDPTRRINTVSFRPPDITIGTTIKVQASSVSTQPGRITKTTAAADVEFGTDFDLSDFDAIPTLPCEEFEKTPETTQRTLSSSTPTHTEHTTLKSTRIDFDIPLTLSSAETTPSVSSTGIVLETSRPGMTTAGTTTTSSQITSLGTTSAEITTLDTTSAETTTLGTTSVESSSMDTTFAEPTTLGSTTTGLILETATFEITTDEATSAVTAPGLTSAVETTMPQTTTSVETSTLGTTSIQITTLGPTSQETTTLGMTSVTPTTSVSSTGLVLETSTFEVTTAETTSAMTTPGLTSAFETNMAQTNTSSQIITLGTTSIEATTLGTTSVGTTKLGTTSVKTTTLGTTSAEITTLGTTSVETTTLDTTSAKTATLGTTSIETTALRTTSTGPTSAEITTISTTSEETTTLGTTSVETSTIGTTSVESNTLGTTAAESTASVTLRDLVLETTTFETTTAETHPAITLPGLTSAVVTTMAQTSTSVGTSTLGTTSIQITTLETTSAGPTSAETATLGTTLAETSTHGTTSVETTSLETTSAGPTSAEMTTLGTTSAETSTHGGTSVETTTLETTSAGPTSAETTNLGTTSAKTTTLGNSSVESSTLGTTSVESTTLSTTSTGPTSAETTTLGTTSVETTSLGTTYVQTTSLGTTFAETTTFGTTFTETTTLGITSAKATTLGTSSVESATQGTTSEETTTLGTITVGTTTLETTSAGPSFTGTTTVGATSVETTTLGTTSAKAATLGTSSVETTTLGTISTESSTLGSTSVKSTTLETTSEETTTLSNTSVGTTTLETTSATPTFAVTSTVDATSVETTTLGQTSAKGTSLGTSSVESTTLGTTSAESSTLDSTSVESTTLGTALAKTSTWNHFC
ncbi:mucin-17-like isoform X2 [Cyprinus carpio]|uniref:Mucin-17-like isoform X2 n=1 Tax=Cyprinus carpio TaxID=7962 RepID=A0A9Q9YMT2_CYPCA|nr:mucin-17-like isoform X2 [Cyprinus carpio]